MAPSYVSRNGALSLACLALVALAGGCADLMRTVPEAQRLHAQSEYERGVTLFRESQLSAALPALQQAVTLDPQVSAYHNALGVLYLSLRRPDLALEPFKRAVALDASYAEAQLNVGIALAEAGRWEEAVTAYQKAIALPTLFSPQTAHQNLGLALYHLKRYAEAERALDFAISLDPRMEGAYYNLGLVLIAEDRKADATLAFRKVGELAPNSPFGQAAVERLKDLGR